MKSIHLARSRSLAYPCIASLTRTHNLNAFDSNFGFVKGFNGHKFVGIKAYHSENTAFGVIIEAEEKKYYITGDTLYNRNIFKELPEDIYAVFLPINGVGNNMNMADAARFAIDCGAKLAVPIHFGMFDNINPEDFIFENRVIPEVYKKIPI